MDKICGGGAACELVCPIMQSGRVCPSVEVYLEESSSPAT